MCEFCKKESIVNSRSFLDATNKLCIGFDGNKYTLEYEGDCGDACFDTYISEEISHCPKCGRNLSA
jgi:hypothetical protein